MNIYDFLNELRRELSFLPADELEDAIAYYEEYIRDSADEETALQTLGSPKRVAEDIRREYYGKTWSSGQLPAKITNRADSGEPQTKRPVWVYVLVAVLAIGFGVPLLKFVGEGVSSLASVLVLALLALLLFKFLKRQENKPVKTSENIETCSDIQNLDIRLGAGRFVIEQGAGFRIEGGSLRSRIENGTWYISRDITENFSEAGNIVTISVPSFFTANKAVIRLGAGDLVIKGLSAYEAQLDVAAGNMEALGLYSKKLDIRCGVGKMKADASLHGDVSINCGMGEATLRLTNRAEEFNYTASVGLGKVSVGEREINGTGQTVSQAGAPYAMSIKCGMGSVKVDFGGVG